MVGGYYTMVTVPTYDDFEKVTSDEQRAEFVLACITAHKNSDQYKMAEIADL